MEFDFKDMKKVEFKEFSIEECSYLNTFLRAEKEFSCENSFVNLYIWQQLYGNRYAIAEDMLFVKSGLSGKDFYALPFGGDVVRGVELLREHTGERYPTFWVQEGARFDAFNQQFGESYVISESRSDADYIYLREALSELKGKKYHSKRNHISAFTRQWDWRYEPIGGRNIDAVAECARLWYYENAERMDEEMKCERQGVFKMLSEFNLLGLSGGAVLVGDRVVAFTLGSPINSAVFDIHIEKALAEFSGAYSVINREFAAALQGYTYINREDDLGLEGLRRAKLSYHPQRLLNKYICYPKSEGAANE